MNWNLDANSLGRQITAPNSSETHNAYLRTGLTHYVFSNQSHYQGTYYTALSLSGSFESQNAFDRFDSNLSLSHNSQNRFYLREKLFIGAHGGLAVSPSISFEDVDDTLRNGLNLNVAPSLSIGLGRIEYTTFARQAMDVNRLLNKTGTIGEPLNESQLKSLSDQIGKIRNKRGFDRRLLRIWQLEQLDSTLNSIGVETTKDIAYFSRLNDAFYYSQFNSRLSGLRTELGVTTPLRYARHSVHGSSNITSVLGFLKLDYYLPASYAMQYDLGVSVYGGLNRSEFLDNSTIERYPVWTTAYFSTGWYPTTRTRLKATINGGHSMSNSATPGLLAGIQADMYYYLSPATRLAISGGYNLSNDYDYTNNSNPSYLIENIPSIRYQGYYFNVEFIHQIF
ncbi:MAG: hypothetical protein MI810_24195 [Flavobacteriales bacterium]|nr:hypothetical protein [Flavobacteriales bacterium]